jgi:CheY-like chemotaxis protein
MIAGNPRRGWQEPSARGESMAANGFIVIVEPDDLIRQLLECWLAEAGYRIALSVNAIPPGAGSPRLIIADICSPAGPDRDMAALGAAYAAPILALSARFRRGLGGSIDAAQRLGVSKVLPKPFTREELLDAVGEAIRDS